MRRVVIGALVLLSSLYLVSCKKEKTSWASSYELILVNDTLRLNAIATDSIFSHHTQTGDLWLDFEKEIFDFDISRYVTIPDTTIVHRYGIALNSYVVQPGFSIADNAKDHQFNLQGAKLTFAGVKSGTLMIEIENPYQTKATFEITLPKVSKSGVVLKRQLTIDEGTQANPTKSVVTVDIADFDLDLTGTNGDGFNRLQSYLKITTDPNGLPVEVTKYDTTTVKVAFQQLKIDRAKGYFGQQKMTESFVEELAFFNKLSGIVAIEDYNLSLLLENTYKVEGELKINKLSNTNTATGTTVDLQHELIGKPIFIQSATGNWQQIIPFKRTFNFLPTNSNLGDLMSNLGSQFDGSIDFALNPTNHSNVGWNEMFSDSRVKVKLKAEMPLKIMLNDLVFKDTFAINLNNQTDKTHFSGGRLLLDVTNAYPIDLMASIELLDEHFTSLGVIQSNERILPSTEGTQIQNGLVMAKSKVVFAVDEAIAEQLEKAKHLVLRVRANTFSSISVPGAAVTTLPYNGFLATKLYGDFKVNFKF